MFGTRFRVHYGDVCAHAVRRWGILREKERPLIAYILRHLGANYGFYSVLAAMLLSEGEVHSFEPVERTFDFLTYNLRQCETACTLHLNRVAIADRDGTSPFRDETLRGNSGKSRICTEDLGTGRIPCKRLDTYVFDEGHAPPDFIKIDVDGAEASVLSGARELLSRSAPVLALESWKDEKGPVRSILREHGYAPLWITAGGDAKAMMFDEIDSRINDRYANILFKK